MPRAGYSKKEKRPERVQRLVEAAYVKGVFDALVGNGSVFVSGVGLVSGLLPDNISLLEDELIRNAKNRQKYSDQKLIDSLPDGSEQAPSGAK